MTRTEPRRFPRPLPFVLAALALCTRAGAGERVGRLTHNHITWTFDRPAEWGAFVNGEYWVIGPVKVVAIANDLNAEGFAPRRGQNGSTVNPRGGGRKGYDDGARAFYDESMNAALPGGAPLGPANPLELRPGDSLVSMVSWLFRDKDDREPGCPRLYATGTPRPALRAGSVLTCLGKAPPSDAFRPPYCGTHKPIHRLGDLDRSLLKDLAPVEHMPDLKGLEAGLSKTWFDDCAGWDGAVMHPSLNMPNYGRDMGQTLAQASLMVHVDFGRLPGAPGKDRLLIGLVQFGIDLAAIAGTGGHWPADGGHGLGRKWPILFAGLMLRDDRMKSVGTWSTRFQEDETTFRVSRREVDVTNGPGWRPDRRSPVTPYTKDDIGTPEWGIRHATEPARDNAHWRAVYREINNSVFPGFALAARIMGQKEAWNHDAFFDYADRVMKTDGGQTGHNRLPRFCLEMWRAYREDR